MVDISDLIKAVAEAARFWRDPEHPARRAAVAATLEGPNRFTEEAMAFSINQQMHLLTERNIESWVSGRRARESKMVGVLNPGNVPLVELQDFLAVLLTGHSYFGVLSSASPHLLPAFAQEVRRRTENVHSTFGSLEEMLASSSVVIATGSDTTRDLVSEMCDRAGIRKESRLLRGNRFAVAVMDGLETPDDLEGLAEDMLLYDGLGCRNVALVWAPAGATPDPLLDALAAFRAVFPAHTDSPGAQAMQQAFLKAAGIPHAYGENLEFLVSRGDPEVQPPGHVRWAEYGHLDEVNRWIDENRDRIQLVVANQAVQVRLEPAIEKVAPGFSQRPGLDWCPDGIDTVAFLANV